MEFSILALAATFTYTALATVLYGELDPYDGESQHIAWIDGADPCSYTIINNNNQNPCGISFELSNGYSYNLQGCGTSSFALYNSDGSYNHKCTYDPQYGGDADSCAGDLIYRDWSC